MKDRVLTLREITIEISETLKKEEVFKMSGDKIQRDRLNAYVDPDTTKIISEIKQKQFEELGVKFTIGQCVDYLAKNYKDKK